MQPTNTIKAMNLLSLFTKSYGALQNYGGMPFWVMTPFRRIIRKLANRILPHYLAKPVKHDGTIEKNLIISFTSFPARINDVWMVIESLKRQTVLPEKIILWLSKDQFPNVNDIPDSLKQREDNLFEIRLVDGDIRSHKKYFYAMTEFPDKTFITCDDDVFYPPNMVKNLITAARMYPGCIIANVSSEMTYDENGVLLPYVEWKNNFKPYASRNRVQIGIGGVLYPPNCLSEMVLRKDLFTKLSPMADDLWLSLMARLTHTPVVQSSKNILNLPIEDGSPSLSSVNNGEKNMNDVQICNMRNWLKDESLPDIYDKKYVVENQSNPIKH